MNDEDEKESFPVHSRWPLSILLIYFGEFVAGDLPHLCLADIPSAWCYIHLTNTVTL